MSMRKEAASVHLGPIPVWLYVASDERQFGNLVRHLGVDPGSGFMRGNSLATTHLLGRTRFGPTAVCICMRRVSKLDIITVGLAAHEASHAVDFIFETMGEDTPGEETKAYLIQYITQATLEIISGRKAITTEWGR